MRRQLASLLDGCGALRAILATRRHFIGSPWLTILTYHRVSEGIENRFDRGVIDATPDEFETHVRVLRRYFNLVGVEDVVRFLDGGELPRNPALITFDDGYRDCLTQALPILVKHAAPAVFFIATSYVEERRLFWWDQLAYALSHTTRPVLELAYPSPQRLLIPREPAGRQLVLSRLLNMVKRQSVDALMLAQDVLRAAEVGWDRGLEARLADELVMNWDEVRALSDAGMDVESHTRTHRILRTVPEHELESELLGSRTDLEAKLGKPVRALAYPVGHAPKSPAARTALEQAGYRLGFSNMSGVTNMTRTFDAYDVKRISVELNLPHNYFRALLAIPQFAEARC